MPEHKRYYYKVNIYCDIYFRGGFIEEDVELDTNKRSLNKDVREYVIEEYGKEFYNEATEYGSLEIVITYTEDPAYKNEPFYRNEDEDDD